MNLLTAAIISISLQIFGTSYQEQFVHTDETIRYQNSLEFLNCRNCPAPTLKTKKKKDLKDSKEARVEKVSKYINFSSPSNPASGFTKIIVNFDFNKAELKESEKEKISEIKGHPVRITGYTDSIGAITPNKTLAMQRAKAVANLLQKEKGMLLSSKTITGKGSCCYIETNKTEEGRAKNRRVEILFNSKNNSDKDQYEGR